MIEFDLGDEPDFDELTFVSEAVYLGDPKDEEPEKLNGRVKVGGPLGCEITEKRAAKDEKVRRFIKENSGRFSYYLVWLSVNFHTYKGPALTTVRVKLMLTADPGSSTPVALDLRPDEIGSSVKRGRKVTIEAQVNALKFGDAKFDRETTADYEQADLFACGLGLYGSTPSWEFSRIPGKALKGSCELELIIQAARGATVTVGGTVHAQVSKRPSFRAELPRPLTLTQLTLNGKPPSGEAES